GESRRFAHDETNPIEATFVIVDEVSMVDVYLMHALLKALRPGTKLLLVGDKDQLPSVGAGNVLGDILASGVVPVSRLTQVYRQAQESLIVTNAHRINGGELPQFKNGADSDFFFLQREQTTDIRDTIVEMVTKRLPAYLGKDASCVQVLAPIKNGVSGVHALNLALQAALNPPREGETVVTHGDVIYRTGDKVMHVVNDYELEWKKRDALFRPLRTSLRPRAPLFKSALPGSLRTPSH
ncbi:MAG: AAA family ATPase, partial [Aeriscardovia sp.]|nr:AAA family ATPase [Aeriscardovia sp.]